MKLARCSLALLFALALTGLVVGAAGAKPKNQTTTLQVGKYSGRGQSAGKSVQVTAEVTKDDGKLMIQVGVPATFSCSDGSSSSTTFVVIAEVRNNGSFSSSETGPSSGITYKLNGRATDLTAVTGTASKAGPKTVLEPDPPECRTGTISFTLKKKK